LKHASVGKKYDSQRIFQYFRKSILEKMGMQANLFGSTVMRKVKELGVKLPSSARGIAGSKLPGTDDFIVIEASS